MPEGALCRVVLVDDLEQNRYVVSRILQRAGFTVEECINGKQALEFARTRPDLAIVDVRLPDISGYEVCRRMKGDSATSSIPVLLISAAFNPRENIAELVQAGADGYLTYPVVPADLVGRVKSLLNEKVK
ncbi:MAG: response regulator [Candidatus Angelobacter sp.]